MTLHPELASALRATNCGFAARGNRLYAPHSVLALVRRWYPVARAAKADVPYIVLGGVR